MPTLDNTNSCDLWVASIQCIAERSKTLMSSIAKLAFSSSDRENFEFFKIFWNFLSVYLEEHDCYFDNCRIGLILIKKAKVCSLLPDLEQSGSDTCKVNWSQDLNLAKICRKTPISSILWMHVNTKVNCFRNKSIMKNFLVLQITTYRRNDLKMIIYSLKQNF